MATTFTVTQLTGQAWIRSADGTLTPLQMGMQVPLNANIVTAEGASVQLQAEGMLPITIGGGRDVQLSVDMLVSEADPADSAVSPPPDEAAQQVLAALDEGTDPFDELDSTSALQSASQGGHDGVSFMRMVSLVEITAPMALTDPRSTSSIDLGARIVGGTNESRETSVGLPPSRPGATPPAQSSPNTPVPGQGAVRSPIARDDFGGQLFEDSPARLAGNVISNDVFQGPVSVSWAGAGNATVLQQLSQYGTISLGANGAWRFALDNSKPATQGLVAGQVVEFNLGYVLTASGGNSDPATLSFRIIGTNDVPVISGDQVGAVREDTVVNVSGKLSISDADAGQSAFIPARIEGAFGVLTIDANGNWSYALANSNANVQSMAASDTAVELITVRTVDGTATQIAINITGTNDEPTITGAKTGALVEDASATVSGKLNITDIDADEAAFAAGRVSGNYGSLTIDVEGNWVYTLAATSRAAVQALGEGVKATDRITVLSVDGTATEIVITITGTNDEPTITGATTGSLTEDGLTSVSGKLDIADVDSGESHFVADFKTSQYGSLTIDADGNWTYKLAATSGAAIQALGEGETVTDRFTVLSADNTPTEIVITITGTNDAPAITGTKIGAITEDAATSVSGKLEITDVDSGESHFIADFKTSQYGSLTIDGAGNWTYKLAATSDAAIQALGEGQTATDVFTFLSADGTPTEIVITITGINDVPTITGTTTAALVEDGDITASGTLHIADVDAGESHFVADIKTSQYGSLTIDADGNWTYKLAATSDAAIQALGEGQTATDTFTVLSADGTPTEIVITITGTNDVPQISGVSTGGVTEDTVQTVSGTLLIEDVDAGESAFAAETVTGIYGSLVIDANGGWTYTLANDQTNVQSLGAGKTATDVITVRSVDGTETQITITITGTNDVPTITGAATGELIEDAEKSVSGKLEITDVDAGESHFVAEFKTSQYGSLTIDADGNWTYRLAATSDAAIQALGEGQTVTDRFTVLSADGTPTEIAITITGTNDLPEISGMAAGAVQEDSVLSAQGQLAVSDVDANDIHTWTVQNAGQGTYGTLVVDQAGKWTYTLENASVQSLGANDIRTETFTVQVDDGQGGVDAQTITITITGTNDVPTITGAITGDVTEDTTTTFVGKLNIVDVDAGQSAFVAEKLTGDYGSLTIDANGNWTYTLANEQANVQSLGAGQTATDVMTVQSMDGTETQITITITGTNDVPTISGATTGSLTEDDARSVSGKLNITDVDAGESNFVADFKTSQHGSLTIDADGNWTYKLAATSDAAIQALGEGQTATDTFTVLSADGTPTEIVITITGTNDLPEISGVSTGGVTEDTVQTVSGTLLIEDVDAGESAFEAETVAGIYGSLAIDATGSWTYTLANEQTNVQSLGAGKTATDVITVRSVDGTETQITITITGTNDAPAITGTKTGAITEDAATTASGKLEIIDIDSGESHFIADLKTSQYGSLTIDADGNWTYKLAATSDAAIQALGEGQTATDTFTVLSADGTPTEIVITITGTNDVPQISGVLAGSVTEDTTTSFSGTLLIEDVDAGESGFEAETVTGIYGSLAIDANGSWTYTLANEQTNIQSLGVGKTATDVITVRSVDGTETQITITITGTNDAPTITGATTGELIEDDVRSITGKLDITDVDSGDSHFSADSHTSQYGSLVVEANGNWTYRLAATSDDAIQALAEGQTATDTFTVLSADGTPTEIVITITGTNDLPEISGVATGAVQEDSALTAQGQLAVSDVDATDTHTWTVQNAGQGTYGTLAVDQTGKWTYMLNNASVQSLRANDTKTETFTVQVSDGQGGTDTQTITITITGTNDVPQISGVSTGGVTEDTTTSFSGTLLIEDVDAGESAFEPDTIGGIYGSLTIDATGSWTYTLANEQTNVQSLGAGKTATDVITVRSVDGTETQITITISGTNDAPAITGVTTGELIEDDVRSVVGKLDITDVDSGESHFIADSHTSQYGSLVIDANGNWTYRLAATSDAAIQALGEGQTTTDAFTVLSADGTPTEIVITITGTNDVPTITGAVTGDVTEDTTTTFGGKLSIVDVDAGQSAFVAEKLMGDYGSLTIDANGNWTYTLANEQADVQSLGAGQTATDLITVQSVDGTETQITITITGTNDVPTITGASAGELIEDAEKSVSGKLEIIDVDAGESHFIADFKTSQYGSLAIDADGNWTYKLAATSDAAIQALGEGQTATDTFTVLSADGTPTEIVITITGTNDVPTITGDVTGDVTEDTTTTFGGKLNIVDVDAGQSAFVAEQLTGDYGSLTIDASGSWTYTLASEQTNVQSLGAGKTATDVITVQSVDGTETQITITIIGTNDVPTITGAKAGELIEDDVRSITGKLDITDVDSGESHFSADSHTSQYGSLVVDANGNWTYRLAATSDAAIQALGEGETVTDRFTVLSADGTPTEIVITITGTNDVPKISGALAGAVTEDTTTSFSGTLLIEDVDAGESAFEPDTIDGIYGSLTIDANGGWTYTLANDQTNVQSLGAGKTATDVITVQSVDGTETQITITITGTNDVPTITGVTTGELIEDDVRSVTGKLGITDVDAGESHFIADFKTSQYGSLTINADGTWTYRLAATSDAAIQALGAGQTATDTFAVLSADGTPTEIVITITGTNDVPKISGALAGAVTEDTSTSISGKLDIVDVDAGESAFEEETVAGIYGSLTIDASGSWSYTLANDQANVQSLGAGKTATDVIIVRSVDGTETQITITIAGTNDVPTITGAATGELIEDAEKSVSGKLEITDVDSGESHFIADLKTSQYGSLVIDADGNWTYKLAATSDAAIQALGEGQTATDTFTVLSADGTPTEIVITITGTNDVPQISGVSTGGVTEDTAQTVSGALLIEDVDAGESAFEAETVAGIYGSLTIDASGSWSYTLANEQANVQSLGAGQTATDVITVQSVDGTETQITITITGTNDVPTITGATTGSLTEDDARSVSGKLNITDVDAGESHFVADIKTSQYGSLTIDADGNWTYKLAATSDAAIQALGERQTVTDRFTVLSADGTPTEIAITITGTNDLPEISGVATGAVQEDSALTAQGQLAVSDVDANDTHTWTVQNAGQGTYGTLAVDQTGKWTYTLENSSVQSLGANDTKTETFTVQVNDGQGGTDTQTITITITGTNDVPQISGVSTGGVTEDTVRTVTGTLLIEDVDAGESAFEAGTVTGIYGSLMIDANGSWTYTLANDQTNVQSLGAGKTATDVITVRSVDGTETQITITITGTNDVPTISGATTASLVEDGDTTVSGKLLINDVDAGESHFVADIKTSQYGSLTIDADGNWIYKLAATGEAAIQALGEDQTATDTFTVLSADGTPTDIVITITGTNDRPEINGVVSGAVEEDATLTAQGQLSVADVDQTDTHVWSIEGSAIGQYGSIVIGEDGKWVYTLDNASARVQALGQGQERSDTFTVLVSDGHGGTDTQTITVKVIGTNDAPVLTVTESGSLTEDANAPVLSVEGALSFSDVDVGDTHTLTSTYSNAVWSGGVLSDEQVSALQNGLTVDRDSWTYEVANSVVQFLGAGQTLTVSFNVTVTDSAQASATERVTITITGTNDVPQISGRSTGDVTEDTATTASGTLLITDVDAGESAFEPDTIVGIYGSLTIDANGSWTYTLANEQTNVQSLGAGKTATDTITVRSVDGTETQITITITGTNDAPVISGVATGAVKEDGTLTAEGQLIVRDVDMADTHDWLIQDGGEGAYGALVIGADGKWTYTLDNTSVQSLGADDSRTETFTVQVDDGQGGIDTQTITITITGTNDVPEINGIVTGAVQEDSLLTAQGQLTVSDVDATDTHTWTVQSAGQGTYGTLVVDQTGKWTYTLDNASAQSLGANATETETFTVQVDDGQGGVRSETVTITIVGTNDVPKITGAFAGDVIEDTATTATGKLNIVDVDTAESLFKAGSVQGTYGSLSIDANGNWTYTLANEQANVQGLAEGETTTEVLAVTSVDGTETLITITITGTNDAPMVEAGQSYASGFEDTSLALTWDQFNITDVDSPDAALGIVITGPPTDGVLFFDGAPVTMGQVFSKADIDSGKLTFMPDANESGFDGHPGAGAGDQHQDYARFTFKPTDGVSQGENTEFVIDIQPVVDTPNVIVNVGPGTVHPGIGSQVTKVNGGSEAADGRGFDVLDGKIVAIGENVRIWYTDARTGSTRDGSVVHHQDLTAQDILQIIENSLAGRDLTDAQRAELVAQMQANFIPYKQGNANAGASGIGKTDIFILHENSLYEQNAQTDNQGTTYHSYPMNAGTGNGNDTSAPDFIFLRETAGVNYRVDGVVSHEWHVNEPNHNDSWTITANGQSIVSGFNQLAGLISSSGGYFGSSGLVVPPEDGQPSTGYVEYDVTIVAHVADQDGSEKMSQEIVLSGLPEGAVIILANGQHLTVGQTGTVTILGDLSNFEDRVGGQSQVGTNITIRVPEGSSFELVAEAKAYETALAEQNAVSGYGSGEVTAPPVEVPVEEDQPGDPENLRSPTVNVEAFGNDVVLATPATMQVNGGAGQRNGFDVENGQIVRIGAGVLVWLSRDDAVPTDHNGNKLAASQIIYYDSVKNGNMNAVDGFTNIFVLHEGTDTIKSFNKVNGNRQGSLSDYVFVPDTGNDYGATVGGEAMGGGASHNPLNKVELSIEGLPSFGRADSIKGVIFGNGQGHEFGSSGPGNAVTVTAGDDAHQRIDVTLTANPHDAEREELMSQFTLTGIPTGVLVYDAAGSLLSAVSGGAYVLTAAQLTQNPDGSMVANIHLHVPEGTGEFELVVEVSAKLIGDESGRTVSAAGSVDIAYGMAAPEVPTEEPEPDDGHPDDGSGDDAPEPDDGGSNEVPETPAELVLPEGPNLLQNGDFKQYAPWSPGGSPGNIYAGFDVWTATGDLRGQKTGAGSLTNGYIMEGKDYIGVWSDTPGSSSSLSQHISGIEPGSILALHLAWNNPNVGDRSSPWTPVTETGRSVTFEVRVDGVLYVSVRTPDNAFSPDNDAAKYAEITAHNGAIVNMDQLRTWSETYSTSFTDPQGLLQSMTPQDFEQLIVKLPDTVAQEGAVSLVWTVTGAEGGRADDIMIADVKLVLPSEVDTLQTLSTNSDDAALSSLLLAAPEEETLFGTSGDDTFTWSADLSGTENDPTTSVIKNFGLGDGDPNGSDVLDLSDLLQGEEDGVITQYLHLESQEKDGAVNTIIKVDKDGKGSGPGAGGHDHQIVLENVDLHDLAGSGSQNDMIQQMIADGKLKVDQG